MNSGCSKQGQEPLEEGDNFIASQFGFSIDTVHKRDGNLLKQAELVLRLKTETIRSSVSIRAAFERSLLRHGEEASTRLAPLSALTRAFRGAPERESMESLGLSPLKLIQRHYSWLDDPPRQSELKLPKPPAFPCQAHSEHLSQCLREHQSAPSTEQLSLPGRWLWNMTVPIVQDLFLAGFGHFIDYLQDLWSFNTLILVSFTKWHCPDELPTHEMLGTFCFHSEHTQGTRDRTFNNCHNVCLKNWKTSGTKWKNCNCKRHKKLAWCFAGSVKQKSSDKRNTQIPSPLHMCQRVSPNSSRSGQDRREPREEDGKEMPRKAGRETQQWLCCLNTVTLMIPVTILATPHS